MTGTNETIEPTNITNYSSYRDGYENENVMYSSGIPLGSKTNNTVMIFDANKHVSSGSSFKLSGIQKWCI